MRRFAHLSRWSFIALTVVVSPLRAQSAPARTPAPEVFALLRLVVADSLVGGGTQAGQLLIAADSLSRVLLTNAGLVADNDPPMGRIMCPGSKSWTGASAPPPAGYRVNISLRATPDSAGWFLGVGKSCVWRNLGRGRGGFAEGCEWEIRNVAGHWKIVHQLGCDVT